MPTPGQFPRFPWFSLTLLALGGLILPPVTAKPPDLPAKVDVNCSPEKKPTEQSFEIIREEEYLEQEFSFVEPRSMADRCASMRTITRCILFGMTPLAEVLRLDHWCEFDEEPPYPVLRVGARDVNVHRWATDIAITVTSGPFGVFFWKAQPATTQEEVLTDVMPARPQYQTDYLIGGAIIEGRWMGGEIEESEEPPQNPDQTSQHEQAKQWMLAGQIYQQLGHLSEACECYIKVRGCCAGSCFEREASARLADLFATMYQAEEKATQTESEEQTVPTVCPGIKTSFKKKSKSPEERTVLENIDALKEAAKLYQEAEYLLHEGEIEQACNCYERIQKLCPGHRYADMAGERLNQVEDLRETPNDTPGDAPTVEGVVMSSCGVPDFGPGWLYPQRKDRPSEKTDESAHGETPAGDDPIVSMGYDISDLLHSHDLDWNRKTDELKLVKKDETSTRPEELVELIQKGIDPRSWQTRGGRGRIEYSEPLRTLFIHQTPEVHEQVQELVDSLRRENELHREYCQSFVEVSEAKTGSLLFGAGFNSDAGITGCLTGKCQADGGTSPKPKRKIKVCFPGGCYAEPVLFELPCVPDPIETPVWTVKAVDLGGMVVFLPELLEDCQQALVQGRQSAAEALARTAWALDREKVASDPLVYKMQMLNQILGPSVSLQPTLPPVDPSIVRAFNEILEMTPPRLYIKVEEPIGEEEQEPDSQKKSTPVGEPIMRQLIIDERNFDLQIVTEKEQQEAVEKLTKLPICVDLDLNNPTGKLRFRFQIDLGSFSFHLVRDRDGHGVVELTVGTDGAETEEAPFARFIRMMQESNDN